MRRSDISLLKVEIDSDFYDLERIVSEIKETVKVPNSSIPTYRDKAALGALIHSFYNGIENVLKRVAEEVDHSVPVGEDWHRLLLRRMKGKVKGHRPPILRNQTVEILEPYLGFRHFFRHSYTFEIDWQKLKPLAKNIEIALKEFRTDLENFFSKLSQAKRETFGHSSENK
jgi:hypothetical protein